MLRHSWPFSSEPEPLVFLQGGQRIRPVAQEIDRRSNRKIKKSNQICFQPNGFVDYVSLGKLPRTSLLPNG